MQHTFAFVSRIVIYYNLRDVYVQHIYSIDIDYIARSSKRGKMFAQYDLKKEKKNESTFTGVAGTVASFESRVQSLQMWWLLTDWSGCCC